MLISMVTKENYRIKEVKIKLVRLGVSWVSVIAQLKKYSRCSETSLEPKRS